MTRCPRQAQALLAASMCLAAADPPPTLEPVSIVGEKQAKARIAGSAHAVDEDELDRFEHDDIHRVLDKTPGVYTRTEDGYGLRPNIGLRGASSDRSAKVTLMEDGVLFAPAPYSAPAAYYFPLTTRMIGVEVFKGPASIRHGPNTIGGAVNLVSRPIPYGQRGGVDVGGGQHGFLKAHMWAGYGGDRWGVLAEGVRLGATGFKDLDDGGPTGFSKAEGLVKIRWDSDPDADVYHRLELRLGQAGERSQETYLGLTDGDFRRTPYRRYAASQLGRMEWGRREIRLGWTLELGDEFTVRTVAYRHSMDRSWRKFDGFAGANAPDLRQILSFPDGGSRAIYADLLRGALDSDRTDDTQKLRIGTNDRSFVSQGVQTVVGWRFLGGPEYGSISQDLELGLRIHQDSIDRDHTSDDLWMTGGVLQSDGEPAATQAQNTGRTVALAAHVADEIRLGDRLFVTPGLRIEHIASDFEDRLNDDSREHRYTVLVPGLGAYYQLTRGFGLLAGVHRGFSPVSPASAEGSAPERSLSYEAGARYASEAGGLTGELVGFFNDYDNLTASCSQSSVGCPADQLGVQFAAGAVDVWGLEAMAAGAVGLPGGVRLTTSATYTLTLASFRSEFQSAFGQWGQVRVGDELPYLPIHRGSASVGFATLGWSMDSTVRHTGELRDQAGAGAIPKRLRIPAHTVVDIAMAVFVGGDGSFYAKIDNAFGADYIASRRPFGVRPGKPVTLSIGYKQSFGR